MASRIQTGVAATAIFCAGIAIGGYLFADTQPRSLLAIDRCAARCYLPSELAGLVASLGIQRTPALIPEVVRETDRCIAIRHPIDRTGQHFVAFTKRDIRNITSLTADDTPYVIDCLAVLRSIVEERGMQRYRVYTNGPDTQKITYLHFHLVDR